jgi:hypothetical protein
MNSRDLASEELNGFVDAMLGLECKLEKLIETINSGEEESQGKLDHVVFATLGLFSLQKSLRRWSSTARQPLDNILDASCPNEQLDSLLR